MVLSQFSSSEGKKTLKDFFDVPSDVYPVGRLDYDSEGLLILTNDKALNHRLLNPQFFHEREYWVQLEGEITKEAIQELERGVIISFNGHAYQTKKSDVRLFPDVPDLAERIPPIRYRKNIPTSWISLTLTEGKNRQVRKMTAATGFPTLRLVRIRIGTLSLQPLLPGEMKELSKEALDSKLFPNH